MSTLNAEDQAKIAAFLDGRHIRKGLGTPEEACSIAAINLALYGRLTDTIPECMSQVIGRWIITIQDAMPDDMRNSAAWRALLPHAAGTGRAHEAERLALILDWMWGTVLPHLQPQADVEGFGAEWRVMCEQRTDASAARAKTAARVRAADAAAACAARAKTAARVRKEAAAAAAAAEAAEAAEIAWAAEAGAARAEAWDAFNPCGLLARLIAVSEQAP